MLVRSAQHTNLRGILLKKLARTSVEATFEVVVAFHHPALSCASIEATSEVVFMSIGIPNTHVQQQQIRRRTIMFTRFVVGTLQVNTHCHTAAQGAHQSKSGRCSRQ